MSLTPKQEKFCQCIVSGMSGKDSYIEAYNCSSNGSAMVESTKLLKRDDITQRIKELRKPIENLVQNKAISEREKKKSLIWQRIEQCIADNDDGSIARYLDILNKMDNEYININRNIEDKPGELINLDTKTLQKLVKTS